LEDNNSTTMNTAGVKILRLWPYNLLIED